MCRCVYAYMYVYICVHASDMYACAYVCICACVYVSTYIYYVCIITCIYASGMYACAYVCTYVCVYNVHNLHICMSLCKFAWASYVNLYITTLTHTLSNILKYRCKCRFKTNVAHPSPTTKSEKSIPPPSRPLSPSSGPCLVDAESGLGARFDALT